jgi:glycosyltransferase involved in cell wall biosynthesis
MEDYKYFLTIIVRTYNSSKTIKRCLYSLINQTKHDIIQILIVDDCSTDNTVEICNKFKTTYNTKINIIQHKERYGRGKGLNTSKEYILGKYCCILDSDDFYVYNNYVEFIYNKIGDKNIDYLYSGNKLALHVYFIYLSKLYKQCPILNVNYFEDQYTRWFLFNKKLTNFIICPEINNFYYRIIDKTHDTIEHRYSFNFNYNLFVLFKLIFYNISIGCINDNFCKKHNISKSNIYKLIKSINYNELSEPLKESYDLIKKELNKLNII